MCGFVGVAGSGLNFPSLELLRSMRDTMEHRGPDDAGELYESNVALGFRRLAILDLSPKGHQPMSNVDGSLWIVFNGEIYNHVEMRSKMVAIGYRFRGGSDTEVLLALYERYGTDMFQYINGMFAFALYDKKRRSIILARDRMGVKPLYYWEYDKGVAFSSELKALKDLPGFPRDVNETAIAMYMRLNFVPGAACVYPGIKKLPPAHYMNISLDEPAKTKITKYWEVDWDVEAEHQSESYWLDRIDELLYDAVRIRLRSDVKLGSFLSGGIDSGLITAMAAKITGSDLQAFTVSFPGSASDEKENAQATARHLGISTHIEEIERDALELLPELAPHFDEPFADMSLIPTYQICKRMKNRATVILSGDGGDEMFGGYAHHMAAWRIRYLERIPDAIMYPFLKAVVSVSPEGSWLCRNVRRIALPSRMRGTFCQRDISEVWQDEVLKPEFTITPGKLIRKLGHYHALGEGRTPLDHAQSGDLQLLLPDNMLVKVDRMSMKASVEVRSPFLDYRFSELVPRIPPNLRVKNGQGKYLLRRLAERYLPSKVVHGPKKGFDVPANHWLSGNKRASIDRWLGDGTGNISIIKEKGLEKLWQNYAKHPNYGAALMRVLIWTLWARVNLD